MTTGPADPPDPFTNRPAIGASGPRFSPGRVDGRRTRVFAGQLMSRVGRNIFRRTIGRRGQDLGMVGDTVLCGGVIGVYNHAMRATFDVLSCESSRKD